MLEQFRFNRTNIGICFDDLDDQCFPTDALKTKDMIWVDFLPDLAKEGCEVFAAQANFLDKGCVLTVAMHHAAGDGVACFNVVKLWAANCQAVQAADPLAQAPPELWSDRDLPERIWMQEKGPVATEDIGQDVWQLIDLDRNMQPASHHQRSAFASRGNVDASGPRVMKSAIFYVSPANFRRLHEGCIRELDGSTQVSASHALCALVWRALMKARLAAHVDASSMIDANEQARLDTPIDARSGFSHAMPVSYLGNCSPTKYHWKTIGELTAEETTVASIAASIANAFSGITTDTLQDLYAILRELPDFGVLLPRWHQPHITSIGRSSMMITSLLTLPLDDLQFGDVVFGNQGRPKGARVLMDPFNQSETSICFVLPRTRSGGVEFILNFYEEELELVLGNDEFRKYVDFVTS